MSAIEGISEAGIIGVERGWGRRWKRDVIDHWNGWVPLTIQGDSIAHRQHRLDLDPNYRDAWGRPLVRLTFDFTENERRLHRYVAERVIEIMDHI